jgi:hypothetical protein
MKEASVLDFCSDDDDDDEITVFQAAKLAASQEWLSSFSK